MNCQYYLLFALFSALCTFAQEAHRITDAEREIRAIETVRLISPNKTDAWSGNVAKDAVFQSGNGGVMSKQELLSSMNDETYEDSLDLTDTKFSEFGNVAIFSYVFMRTHHDGSGRAVQQHVRRTVVYQRTASGWQMIASAISVIPYADLESRPVDPKVLESYLGVWTDVTATYTVTLTREGGKLMAQGSNESKKTELLPLSDNTFVVRGYPTLITFEKGPDGKVTRTLLRDLGGGVQVRERAITDTKHR